MDPVAAISLSGLQSATLKAQSAGSNIVNADDTAPLPGSGVAGPAPYVPTRVSTFSLGAGGVQAQLQQDTSATGASYDPTSPYADKNGQVATPNVDEGAQIVDLVEAQQEYKASAALLKVDDEMQKSTLDILR